MSAVESELFIGPQPDAGQQERQVDPEWERVKYGIVDDLTRQATAVLTEGREFSLLGFRINTESPSTDVYVSQGPVMKLGIQKTDEVFEEVEKDTDDQVAVESVTVGPEWNGTTVFIAHGPDFSPDSPLGRRQIRQATAPLVRAAVKERTARQVRQITSKT